MNKVDKFLTKAIDNGDGTCTFVSFGTFSNPDFDNDPHDMEFLEEVK